MAERDFPLVSFNAAREGRISSPGKAETAIKGEMHAYPSQINRLIQARFLSSLSQMPSIVPWTVSDFFASTFR